MTWRGAALLAAAIAIIAAGAAAPVLVVVGAGLVLVVALAVVMDSHAAPGASDIHAVREHDDLLSVGVDNAVTLRIATLRPAEATVREELPLQAHATADAWRTALPCTLHYSVHPTVRGEIHAGRTVLRIPGPLRLGWRQTAIGADDPMRVDADIAAVRVYEALARRGQLAELGVRSMRLPSEGTEREREAAPDDSLRSINWKATARTGRLMASELIPERAQPVIVCVDHARLMGIGAGELTKLDHALNAALLLLHVALRSGDRAGLQLFADSVTARLPPRGGAAQLRRFLDTVRPLRPAETEADYARAFADFGHWQRRRALVVIFTDVLDAEQCERLARQCVHLRRQHLPLLVTVRDPALDEAALREPRSSDDVYARTVAAGVIADRDDSLQLLRRRGVDVIDADPRALSPRVVNRYLEIKRRARL